METTILMVIWAIIGFMWGMALGTYRTDKKWKGALSFTLMNQGKPAVTTNNGKKLEIVVHDKKLVKIKYVK